MFLRRRIAVGAPVHRSRTGSHQSFYAGLNACFDDVVGAVNHHFQALARLGGAGGYSDGGQMKDHLNVIKIWPDVSETANVLLRQLDIAMSPRPLNVMERPTTEVIQYDDQPDLFITDQQVGDVRADQPAPAGY